MSYLEINPLYHDTIAEAGLASVADFLACEGEPVRVRANRRVERIALPDGTIAYLKKESHIPLRERLVSWWSGYGWMSKSVREGAVLGDLTRNAIGCPTILALGEDAGRAFVLLKAERDLKPIDQFLRGQPHQTLRIAKLLGRELARMHEAGFFHPDLFAKHVLIGQSDGLDRVCLIDWQRTRRLTKVPWSRRIADIAALDASLATEAVPPRHRLRLIGEYLRNVVGPCPRLRVFADAVERRSRLLRRNRRVARQRRASVPHNPQHTLAPHDWHNCPLRLADPSFAGLPLVKFLKAETDLQLHRRALQRVGMMLHDLHEAGYLPADPGLSTWVVDAAPTIARADEVEIYLTSAADLTPSADAEHHAADDLARLLAHHGKRLSRGDLLRVVAGYVKTASRPARRDLVRRILAARETAR
jgi:tRNA A-37 threonylcarbamoyl transferase component Bud32